MRSSVSIGGRNFGTPFEIWHFFWFRKGKRIDRDRTKMDDIARTNDNESIDSFTSNGEQLPADDNVSLGAVSNASSTSETNYVRRMAKHFEQITDTSWNDKGPHENFKQCNWWLKTPSIVTTFDDFDGLNDGTALDGDGLTQSDAEW